MTSVKDFRVVEPATGDRLGRGAFVFSDAYSVFDWGQMPDSIPDKGASLCTMGAFNFERLEAADIPTHYRGVVSDGVVCPLQSVLSDDTAPTEMAIDLGCTPELPADGGTYDYDAYHEGAGSNYLIPLEIVYRNVVGTGSSLRDRADPSDVGLTGDTWPDEPVQLPEPFVEFSTKYEEQDRYLDRDEAAEIAGRADCSDLETLALDVNRHVTTQAKRAGLTHQDGKIECLFVDGEIRVADVVGTFDENRFAYDGNQVSKEVLRQYHKRTQPAWVEAVSQAKKQARAAGETDWRSRCSVSPEPLRDSVIEAVRELYCAGTNAYVQTEVFDAPPLADAVEAVQSM